MKKTALIMAGGRGERFWPKSRKTLPKQFLSLTNDGKTMIQLTVERILPLVDIEDIYIATNNDYRELVQEQLPALPPQNILCEPVGRNTAPCIGLGAMHISAKYEDALMFVLPSDHLIKNNDIFVKTLDDACAIAEQENNLVTLGITPNYPETGYGYIKMNIDSPKLNGFEVERFVEKPNIELAKEYLASGKYLWNSGMFIWKVSSIINNIKTFIPDMCDGLKKIQSAIGTPDEDVALKQIFPELESVSIDYGIMEKASDIFVLPGNFGWDDVGSWLAIERIKGADEDDNCLTGNVLSYGTKNCTIEAKDKLIAVVGMKDTIVVDTEDATLICDKSSAGDIKKILEMIRNKNLNQYL